MRYRANVTLSWDFDSDLPIEEAVELAKHYLDPLPQTEGLKSTIRLDKLKEKVQKVRIGEFPLDAVMPYVTRDEGKREYEVDGVKYAVKMNSHRYFLFRECCKCVACGLRGTRIFLEYHPADKTPHFNLYGEEDGKLVLFTKDHIHAKAFGGEDRHSNYQTMCIVCNNLKGHVNLTLEAVRQLREIYNENRTKLTKKKLHQLIEETKEKLAQPWAGNPEEVNEQARRRFLKKQRLTGDAVVTNYDLNIWRAGFNLIGKSVYEKIDPTHQHVACIRKGTVLEPLVVMNGRIVCKLSDEDAFSVPEPFVRPV